jgi:hypothetical protein
MSPIFVTSEEMWLRLLACASRYERAFPMLLTILEVIEAEVLMLKDTESVSRGLRPEEDWVPLAILLTAWVCCAELFLREKAESE